MKNTLLGTKHIIGLFAALAIFLAVPIASIASPENPTPDELQSALNDIEAQIAQYEKELAATTGQKTTLQNKIKQLKSRQNELKLQIKKTNILISDLNIKLSKTQNDIKAANTKITELKNQTAELFRLISQKDNQPVIFTLFSDGGLSTTFVTIENYQKMSLALERITNETRKTETDLRKKKEEFAGQQDDARELLTIKNAQQSELLSELSEQSTLLTETKGKETNYQTILADRKKQAASLRARIYELVGAGEQINFGEAAAIATWVGKQTNVPPAFLLAILTQESNLGKNVGTCNRPNDPPEKGWRVIMKPERDQEPFKTITAELGKDPDTTPVSCPLKDKNGKQYGWGGAMGPAQFIPSTWMGYRNKVTAITGKAANPWDIRDAFIAAAVKLRADGANSTDDGQWKAAMRYFSGSTNTKYRFYGDNVLKLTKKYTQDLADLNP